MACAADGVHAKKSQGRVSDGAAPFVVIAATLFVYMRHRQSPTDVSQRLSHIELSPEGPGVVRPRPPGPNITDSLWRDAKLGRQQHGRARRLGTSLLKDVYRLVGAQPHSLWYHFWKL